VLFSNLRESFASAAGRLRKRKDLALAFALLRGVRDKSQNSIREADMKRLEIAVSVAILIVLARCTTSSHARTVTPSGFLGDSAALLKKGGKDDVLLVYRNPKADWPSYDKIIVDPVVMWHVEDAKLSPDELADYQKLIDEFYRTLKEKLSKDYRIVDEPSSGAMHLQVAIINGQKANAPLKVAKTVAPYAGSADTIWTFATGKPAFAGEVSIEYMIKDSQSGELLVAGADRRVGGNQLGEATLKTWGDVQNILTYWTDEARYLLCVDRKAKDCVKPKAGLVANPVT
jgi:hypothetical protein